MNPRIDLVIAELVGLDCDIFANECRCTIGEYERWKNCSNYKTCDGAPLKHWSPYTNPQDAFDSAEKLGLFSDPQVKLAKATSGNWEIHEHGHRDEFVGGDAFAVLASGDTICEAICHAILELPPKPASADAHSRPVQ